MNFSASYLCKGSNIFRGVAAVVIERASSSCKGNQLVTKTFTKSSEERQVILGVLWRFRVTRYSILRVRVLCKHKIQIFLVWIITVYISFDSILLTPVNVQSIQRIFFDSVQKSFSEWAGRVAQQIRKVAGSSPTTNTETDANMVGMSLLDNYIKG